MVENLHKHRERAPDADPIRQRDPTPASEVGPGAVSSPCSSWTGLLSCPCSRCSSRKAACFAPLAGDEDLCDGLLGAVGGHGDPGPDGVPGARQDAGRGRQSGQPLLHRAVPARHPRCAAVARGGPSRRPWPWAVATLVALQPAGQRVHAAAQRGRPALHAHHGRRGSPSPRRGTCCRRPIASSPSTPRCGTSSARSAAPTPPPIPHRSR